MSRSPEEWNEAKAVAMGIRNRIIDVMEEIEKFPVTRFHESVDTLDRIDDLMKLAVGEANKIIGATSPYWLVDEET